jgi:UPF0755 protein
MRRFVILVLVLLLAAAGFRLWLRSELNRPYKGYSQHDVIVDIPHGTPGSAIAKMLHENGVIRSPLAFTVLSRWRWRHKLQAGEYRFDQPMTPREVFDMIAAGHIYIHTIKVPEGWTMFDIADALEREGLCRRSEFLAAARDPALILDLAPRAQTLEGFLFPATYEFTRHTTPQEIAATMVRRFRTVWAGLPGTDRDTDGIITGLPAHLDVEQLVAMASLVERETALDRERPLVAGVFYNRLQKGMLLQCDPTVMYAMALAGQPVHTLGPGDVTFDSPYNTYRHTGLPPGPIANPGEAALRAVLDPPKVPYLFFVANTEGGHFFSQTLREHNRNVALYRERLAAESDLEDKPVPLKPAPQKPLPQKPVLLKQKPRSHR